MLSLTASLSLPSSTLLSTQAFSSPSPFFFFFFSSFLHRNPRISCSPRTCLPPRACSSRHPGDVASDNESPDSGAPSIVAGDRISSFAGLRLEETVKTGGPGPAKLRLDSWISSRISGISRARVQFSIRSGLVRVNGNVVNKVSHAVRPGDEVLCTVSELQPLKAEPEDIPLDIVYEDKHVLVVNKPANMVVHPAPGNATGTLVNGILHHCGLPFDAFPSRDLEEEGISEHGELSVFSSNQEDTSTSMLETSVRPGIVHRLDKGTSGLLVVAKNEHSHAHLSDQFKLHTIHRVYISLTSGVPSQASGRVDVPIGRDLSSRIRMIATSGSHNCGRPRHAASRYKIIETLAGGASALVEWRLETGRTHQIRAHAKYLGIPLLGDEVYGGTKSMAMSLFRKKTPRNCGDLLAQLVLRLERPCLHALALGFTHPRTGETIKLSCPPPEDFTEILSQLRIISKKMITMK